MEALIVPTTIYCGIIVSSYVRYCVYSPSYPKKAGTPKKEDGRINQKNVESYYEKICSLLASEYYVEELDEIMASIALDPENDLYLSLRDELELIIDTKG